jgi:hypothetical protein
MPTRPAPRFLLALLGLSLLATLVLSGPDTLTALADTWRDVTGHDSEALRLEHHGWYAQLADVLAEIDARVPQDEPIVLDHGRVPAWFVAAYNSRRAIFQHSPELVAEWAAAGRDYWLLTLRAGEPLRWTLERVDNTPPPGGAPR